MRVHLATLLVRLAVRILAGHDDRWVVLNTKRNRSRITGRIYPFVGYGSRRQAYADVRKELEGPFFDQLGVPVPAVVARLAGWDLYGKGE